MIYIDDHVFPLQKEIRIVDPINQVYEMAEEWWHDDPKKPKSLNNKIGPFATEQLARIAFMVFMRETSPMTRLA